MSVVDAMDTDQPQTQQQTPLEFSDVEGIPPPTEIFKDGNVEVVLNNPSEELKKRVEWELAEQNIGLGHLESKLAVCHTDEILPAFDDFVFLLRTLEKEHGPLVTRGYAGVNAIPLVCGHLAKNIQERLPESSQVAANQTLDMFANLLRQLDKSYDGTPLRMYPLSEFMRVHSNPLASAFTLNDTEANWIRERAVAALPLIAEKLQTEKREAEIRRYNLLQDHMLELSHGSLPYGFNTAHEHRYVLLDLSWLLRLDPPDLLTDKLLTPENAAYLQRMAETILTNRPPLPDSADSEAKEQRDRHCEYLLGITRGIFPHGYRVDSI